MNLMYKIDRVCTSPGNPGKSWNLILALKINAGPGSSWKSMKFALKIIFCSISFGVIFHTNVRVYCFNYCAFRRPGKMYLSPGEVLEKVWEIVSEKGYEP